MASEEDLRARGFHPCSVSAKSKEGKALVNIRHYDPLGQGPFCHLKVQHEAPHCPGVYAWSVDGVVMYVGESGELPQVVEGTRMNRPYNDYCYVPPSKALLDSPRVRVNGNINGVLGRGSQVEWWWRAAGSKPEAVREQNRLIAEWRPPWNR